MFKSLNRTHALLAFGALALTSYMVVGGVQYQQQIKEVGQLPLCYQIKGARFEPKAFDRVRGTQWVVAIQRDTLEPLGADSIFECAWQDPR